MTLLLEKSSKINGKNMHILTFIKILSPLRAGPHPLGRMDISSVGLSPSLLLYLHFGLSYAFLGFEVRGSDSPILLTNKAFPLAGSRTRFSRLRNSSIDVTL